MIELNGAKISEEAFAKIAEQQGYEKKYEYPLVMLNRNEGDIWEFISLSSGTCLKEDDLGNYKVGDKADCLNPHTDKNVWQPCERPEELYDGLTEAQWQQVIDDELVVQVSDDGEHWVNSTLSYVFDNRGSPFKTSSDMMWKHCRIHSSQPQFGGRADWVKDDDWVAFKTLNSDNIKVHTAATLTVGDIWKDIIRWQVVKL